MIANGDQIVYECDFDSVINNAVGCEGFFSFGVNGQQSGVVDYIVATATDLKYDVTDLTSTSESNTVSLKSHLNF